MEVLHTSRDDARLSGAKKYSASKPCNHGHTPVRYVSTNDCVECVRIHGIKFYAGNRDAALEKRKLRRERNRAHENKMKQANAKKRRATDPMFQLRDSIRARIVAALKAKGTEKKSGTEEIIGCSIAELKRHIEKQFLPGMDWSNRNEWHVDHIVPLSTAKDEADVIALCHVSNLRPMWAADNLKKSSKVLNLI